MSRRLFSLRTPTGMTIYPDMGYVNVKCPCGWWVSMGNRSAHGNPHVGHPVPLDDFSHAEQHAETCVHAGSPVPPTTTEGE